MKEEKIKKSKVYLKMKREHFLESDIVKFNSEKNVTEPEVMKSEKHNYGSMVFDVNREGKNIGKIHVDVKNGNVLGGMVVISDEKVSEFHHYNKKGDKESVDKLHQNSLLYLEEMTEEQKENLGLEDY